MHLGDALDPELAGEETYFDSTPEKRRVLDDAALHEPIRMLHPADPVCMEAATPASEAVALMQRERIGCVIVTEGGRLRGIFTERDVLNRVAGRSIDLAATPVRDLMTHDPECLNAGDSIAIALNRMSVGGFRHVPLIDDAGRAAGVVSIRDIIDYLADFFPNDVLNIPPEPALGGPKSREGA